MPIIANSLDHIYRALDTYLGAAFVLADGPPLSLRLHGVRRFIPPTDAPWVETHYDFLTLTMAFRNRAGQIVGLDTMGDRVTYATERAGYLQLNIYQRARVFPQRYTLAAVRDAVIEAFPEGDMLTIVDPESGTLEGRLVWDGTKDHVQDTGMLSGVVQHVVQVATRYLELYTRLM